MADPSPLADAFLTGLKGTGIGGTIAASLYGLSLLVRSWREGRPSDAQAQVEKSLSDRLSAVEKQVAKLERKLDRVTRQRDDMRYQRDEARLEANQLRMKHGEEVKLYAADPPPEPEEE